MINEVRLIGNVGGEPEVKSGTNYTMGKCTLATTTKWKDKNGEWCEKTEWHRLVAWGPQAEYLEKYVTKGTLLYVEGTIVYGSYDKDGNTVYTTDIKVMKVKVLNRGKDNGSRQQGRNDFNPPPMGDDVPF